MRDNDFLYYRFRGHFLDAKNLVPFLGRMDSKWPPKWPTYFSISKTMRDSHFLYYRFIGHFLNAKNLVPFLGRFDSNGRQNGRSFLAMFISTLQL